MNNIADGNKENENADMTTIHIDPEDTLLRRADVVLSEQGLSIPQAIRQWLSLIAGREFLPIEQRQPNRTTLDAMQERDEDLPSFTSTTELMMYLGGNAALGLCEQSKNSSYQQWPPHVCRSEAWPR
uniref:Antitoxin component of the RelBE or YafQ-DinJ toxin-antitoxin module n=1 Tax=Candidatus Kentrum sp. SD TaxID=2126332 RepID=A0A450YWM2_9GAMM|nr:MAG: Antitoxin component of the RelBE or YafQ-DinJ toxin-antitoxin module [Candidatus Kentron sp. SD]VFK45913.1 MAG: Antitoxin component of the RelBE or YafQ-DinJ toxin-antitoxin module [Candidatus Kentron sp. SD]